MPPKQTGDKPRVPPKDRRLKWTPTPYVEAGLVRLKTLGILGSDRSQIVNHIIGEELRRLIEGKLLKWEDIREETTRLPAEPEDSEPG